jgi:hypothetical protein
VLAGEGYSCFCLLLGRTPFPAKLMEPCRKNQGKPQVEWIRKLLSQGERRVTSLQGLIRIAQKPQRPGRIAEARHPGVCPSVEKSQETVLVQIVERTALLQVYSGEGKLSLPQQRASQRPVGFLQERRILSTLCHAEELFPQLTRRL